MSDEPFRDEPLSQPAMDLNRHAMNVVCLNYNANTVAKLETIDMIRGLPGVVELLGVKGQGSEFPNAGPIKLIPGGFIYREKQHALSGKPWEVLREFLNCQIHTLTAQKLLATVWNDRSDACDHNVKEAIVEVRRALRKAMGKAGSKSSFNPLPAVDKGRNLAWELKLEQI